MPEISNMSYIEESTRDDLFISDQVVQIYTWVVLAVLCQIINVFGIFTNGINITCFVKQGFKDSVTISLLGLSISDLGSLVTMAWTCICVTPSFVAADLPFDPLEVMYLTSGMAHLSFNRVSSCITAMVTLERCLCIVAPLQIKSIIMPGRVAGVTICIFIIIFSSTSPVYFVNKLDMKFVPFRNKTLVGLVFTEDREYVEKISFIINNFAIPFGAFAIITICTIILSFKLQEAAKWRMQTQVERVSSRSQKVGKMVVMISALFIVCFVPISITMLCVACLPELALHGEHMGIAVLMGGLSYVMESINSSMNIFVYYRMSSNYRDIFCKLFSVTTKYKRSLKTQQSNTDMCAARC